jgi:hypothetical protein
VSVPVNPAPNTTMNLSVATTVVNEQVQVAARPGR